MALGSAVAALPDRRRVTVLVAGRGAWRVAQWVSGIGLLAAWGRAGFATYATALATSAWLIVLVSAGAEKALLALVPRGGGRRLTRLLITVALVPHLAGLAVLAVAVAGWGGVLPAAAAAYSTGVGLVLVLVAVLRLRGQLLWDPIGVGVLGLAHLLVVPAAHLSGWPPQAALAALALAPSAAAALLLGEVARGGTRTAGERGPGLVLVLSTVAFLGATEVANVAGAALTYRVLGAGPHRADAGVLYLALVIAQVFLGLVLYLTRLAAPQVARDAETAGPAAALELGRVVFRRTAATAAVALGVAVPAMVLTSERGRVLVFGAALVATTLAEGGVLYGCYWAENADASGRRACAIAAVTGLFAVAVAAVALVPLGGGVGALTAILSGAAVQSATAAALLSRSPGPGTGRAAAPRSGP